MGRWEGEIGHLKDLHELFEVGPAALFGIDGVPRLVRQALGLLEQLDELGPRPTVPRAPISRQRRRKRINQHQSTRGTEQRTLDHALVHGGGGVGACGRG